VPLLELLIATAVFAGLRSNLQLLDLSQKNYGTETQMSGRFRKRAWQWTKW
jgi:hypothetical protein